MPYLPTESELIAEIEREKRKLNLFRKEEVAKVIQKTFNEKTLKVNRGSFKERLNFEAYSPGDDRLWLFQDIEHWWFIGIG